MKYIIITDTHFGVKNNNMVWCDNQVKFLDNVLIPYLERIEGEWKLLHLGDVFDSRAIISTKVIDEVDKRFKAINDLCERTGNEMIVIGGNHDYYSPENDNVSILNILLRNYGSITLLTSNSSAVSYDNFTYDVFIPWYDFNDIDNLKRVLNGIDGKVNNIFTHTDVKGLPAEYHELLKDIKIYAGHIHQPANLGLWHNLGSTYPLTYSDNGRRAGAYVLEDGDLKMLYNDVSFRFWKYLSMPAETDTANWKDSDLITIILSKSEYDYHIDEIRELKKSFDITVSISPDELEDADVESNLDIQDICMALVPDAYKSMMEKVVSKYNETM